MRNIHLFRDAESSTLVQGINAANPLGDLRIVQNDTLQIFVHNLRRTAAPARNVFTEEPLDFSSIRASIGLIDAPPSVGTFKLRVGGVAGQTTAALTWPSDLSTPALVAAWKLVVLNAVKGLANVANAVELIDDATTPAHLFFFKWTNPANVLEIDVVENKLAPWIVPEVLPSSDATGLAQLVKLIQAPARMTDVFTRPTAPVVTVRETVPGALGTNAEQTLDVQTLANGSFSLTWAGVATKTLAVGTVTAASISAALNAIVASGATAPQFRCEERPSINGRSFAVQFIGALAGAAQPALAVTMHDQQSLPWAVGTLDLLGNVAIEKALNGAASAELVFELVIVDAGGEETHLRTVIVANDMTGPATITNAAAAGAVATIVREVNVDAGLGESFADVSPGTAFTVPGTVATDTFNFTHNLGDKTPQVHGHYRATDSPETWTDLDDNLYVATTNAAGDVTSIELKNANGTPRAVNITTPAHADYFSRFKFLFVASDTRLMVFQHAHTWDTVLDSLPSGQTLRAKLAALEAAIASLGGAVQIPPSSLDLPGLVAALVALLKSDVSLRALFVDLLTTLVTDSAIMRAVATELGKYAEFLTTLKTAFEDDDLLKVLSEQLLQSLGFETAVRNMVLETLQGGAGTLPPGTVLFAVPSWEFIFPPVQEIPAPAIVGESFSDVEITQVAGGTTTKTSGKSSVAKSTAQTAVRYDLLSPALFAPASGGNVTGLLSPTATAGQKYTATTAVNARTVSTRRGRDWPTGAILTRQNGHWYQLRQDGTNYWPVEMEDEITRFDLTAEMLSPATKFAYSGILQSSMEGNAYGNIYLIAEHGQTGQTGNIAPPTWTRIFAQRIALSPNVALHSYALEIQSSLGNVAAITSIIGQVIEFTLWEGISDILPGDAVYIRARRFTVTAVVEFASLTLAESLAGIIVGDLVTAAQVELTYALYGQRTTLPLPGRNCALRVRVANFDCEDLWLSGVEARGCMKLRVINPSASIVSTAP